MGAFLRRAMPELADAPLASSRLCLCCDSVDRAGADREGLVVASGGSGHPSQLAPLLGGWIASAVDADGAPPRLRRREASARARRPLASWSEGNGGTLAACTGSC